MAIDAAAKANIQTEMTGLSLPASTLDTFLQALDAAGYEVTDKGDGTPVTLVDTVTPVKQLVAGCPGVVLCYVDVGDGARIAWIEGLAGGVLGRGGACATANKT